MGIVGTDVAKEASSIVIMDDHFATLQIGIAESRKLFQNLLKAAIFYLSCKLALITLFLISAIVGQQFPLQPVQIIVLEMFMDLGASTTFVIEVAEGDIMKHKPRNPKRNILDFKAFVLIVWCAIQLLSCVLGAYFLGIYFVGDEQQASTLAFIAWLVGHCLLGFQLRTLHRPLIIHGLFRNWLMLVWALAVLVVLICALYIPGFQELMKISTPDPSNIGIVVGGTIGILMLGELTKVLSWVIFGVSEQVNRIGNLEFELNSMKRKLAEQTYELEQIKSNLQP